MIITSAKGTQIIIFFWQQVLLFWGGGTGDYSFRFFKENIWNIGNLM